MWGRRTFQPFSAPIWGRIIIVIAAVLGGVGSTKSRAAGLTYQVVYTPSNNPPSVFDAVPAGVPNSYVIGVTSPGNFSSAVPFAPSFAVKVTTGPLSAGSFISIAPDPEHLQPLGFTRPFETLYYKITGTFDAVQVSTTYTFEIKAAGWPLAQDTFSNLGHFISATSVPPSLPATLPTVTVLSPGNGSFLATSTLPTTLGLAFKATGSSSAPVSTVSATLTGPGTPGVALIVTPSGLINLPTVQAGATMPISAAGVYTVNVEAANLNGTATASVSFTVGIVGGIPPTIQINSPAPNTPPPGNVYTYSFGSSPLAIPFNVSAKSATPGAVIRSLSASLTRPNSTVAEPLTLTTWGVNTLGIADALTTLALKEGGVYTIAATAADDFGTANATTQFTINVVKGNQTIVFAPLAEQTVGASMVLSAIASSGLAVTYESSNPSIANIGGLNGNVVTALSPGEVIITARQPGDANYNAAVPVERTLKVSARSAVTVGGIVFVDVINKGIFDASEKGLAGVTVKLYRGGVALSRDVTTAGGRYSFAVPTSIAPVTYEVDAVNPIGLTPTDSEPRSASITNAPVVPRPIGLGLNFAALRGLTADGNSHGYWKSNLNKANTSKTEGMQESPLRLIDYTNTIAMRGFPPFAGLTTEIAEGTLAGDDQLKVQLLAAEYNLASGRLIDGNELLTFAFILWGEHVFVYSTNPDERTFAKDWLEAFNNSHGKVMTGPKW
jgi:hypothetical protein